MTGHIRGDARKAHDDNPEPLTEDDLLAAFRLGQEQHREHPRLIDDEFMRAPTAAELLTALRAEAAASQAARLAKALGVAE